MFGLCRLPVEARCAETCLRQTSLLEAVRPAWLDGSPIRKQSVGNPGGLTEASSYAHTTDFQPEQMPRNPLLLVDL